MLVHARQLTRKQIVSIQEERMADDLRRFSEDRECLHILCPAGLGDISWILCKLGQVANQRRCKFWLPDGEQKRTGPYLELLNVDHGYLPNLSTDWVWDRPGSPKLPETGWVSVQANRHLEAGCHLSLWYPELPMMRPAPLVRELDTVKEPFCLAFTCHGRYMGGQLSAEEWGWILRQVHKRIAPVRLVGASMDVRFCKEIEVFYPEACLPHLYDRPFEEVLSAARNCRLFFGVAGGPIIASQYMGVPTLTAYPDWLHKMPGTWERPDVPWESCHLRNLGWRIQNGAAERMARR